MLPSSYEPKIVKFRASINTLSYNSIYLMIITIIFLYKIALSEFINYITPPLLEITIQSRLILRGGGGGLGRADRLIIHRSPDYDRCNNISCCAEIVNVGLLLLKQYGPLNSAV